MYMYPGVMVFNDFPGLSIRQTACITGYISSSSLDLADYCSVWQPWVARACAQF